MSEAVLRDGVDCRGCLRYQMSLPDCRLTVVSGSIRIDHKYVPSPLVFQHARVATYVDTHGVVPPVSVMIWFVDRGKHLRGLRFCCRGRTPVRWDGWLRQSKYTRDRHIRAGQGESRPQVCLLPPLACCQAISSASLFSPASHLSRLNAVSASLHSALLAPRCPRCACSQIPSLHAHICRTPLSLWQPGCAFLRYPSPREEYPELGIHHQHHARRQRDTRASGYWEVRARQTCSSCH